MPRERIVTSKDHDTEAAVAAYTYSVIGDAKKPVYLISWEEHTEFNNAGNKYYESSGVLNRWNYDKSDFVPVGPLHNTNHTILTASSISLLKSALEQIIKQ